MTSLFSYQLLLHPLPHTLFSPPSSAPSFLPNRNQAHFFPRTHSPGRSFHESTVARLGMDAHLPDFESTGKLARELLGRVEGVIYTVADASVSSSSSSPASAEQVSKQSSDWFSGITNSLEAILKILKDGLSALHVPYAYGFAIIILTVVVKAATFPLTKKQVESALAMKSLQPQVKAIQQRYAGDQERIQIETARLYKLAGVNPLAGCLPTLATIPVWIGLYRALSNVANEGLLNEGFFWIPSLSGPTTIAARQSGSGTSWLYPFVDGHPPLGWSDTSAYLVLPILLVVSQYVSAQIMQQPQDTDPSQKSSQAVLKFLPLMIGYFALSVPSGLSLYWLTNNLLSTGQQLWLQKLGGARNPVKRFGDEISREETSIILKPLSEMQSSTTVETERTKSSVESKVDSSTPRRGERFKQIKEEEARRRKQREEASRREQVEETRRIEASADGGSRIYTGKQAAEAEFEEKMVDKKSEKFERNRHLSMKTNGELNHSSTIVKQGETPQQDVEMESQEFHAASGRETFAADSTDNRDHNIRKDEA